MRAAIVLVAIVCSLALQPPIVSNLGTQPTPPVVGMSGPTGAEAAPVLTEPNLDLWKYAITQGGLTTVCLVLIGWIIRELKQRYDRSIEALTTVVALVEKTTTAVVSMQGSLSNVQASNERIASGLENIRRDR